MKQFQIYPSLFAKAITFIGLSLLSTVSWAQDKGIDIKIGVDAPHGQWYENKVLWVIGGAVFILLLVALLRNGSKGSGS